MRPFNVLIIVFGMAAPAAGEIISLEDGTWAIEKEITVPGTPEEVYDAFTGDVSDWWDHTFSTDPVSLVIEPRPGGSFMEIFDESGDGVEHARVIVAHRGKMLRLRGPLGFSGKALDMVHTFTFTADGDQTRVHLRLNATGQLGEGWTSAVDGVWDHFLVTRFKAHVEAGHQP